ncbi:MAG: HAD family hydrolase [Candidatus Nanohaloarchaea archaeon]
MRYWSLVLDMDGVLLNYEGDAFRWKYDAVREALQEQGADPEGLSRSQLDAFLGDKGVEACIEACEQRGIDPRTVWELVADKTSAARRKRIEDGEFSLYPDARQAIEKLRSEEVELGLISNAPEAAVEVTVDHYGLRDHFKFFRGIVDFDDLPARKPHPDHLELAKAELKRSPYIYAGDAESDLIAARDAGMDSVWVQRTSAKVDVSPDYRIDDMEDIVDIVENGGSPT